MDGRNMLTRRRGYTEEEMQPTGVMYRMILGGGRSKMEELVKKELEMLCKEYRGHILKWLWMRQKAWEFGWVKFPQIGHSVLRRRTNGYRCQARAYAFFDAMKYLKAERMVEQVEVRDETRIGKPPTEYSMTSRGMAWLIKFDNEATERGEPFLLLPEKEQFVEADGTDKDKYMCAPTKKREHGKAVAAKRRNAPKKKAAKKKAVRRVKNPKVEG